jgi:type III secretion protein J
MKENSKAKILILISLTLLIGCSVKLNENLNEDQANEIIVKLSENGIKAKKIGKGTEKNRNYEVWVSSISADKAWRIVKENDLPSKGEFGLSEIYGKRSLVPTLTEEKALYLRALQGELAKTLKCIDGVINARVHIVLPEEQFFSETEEKEPSKASIFIKYHLKPDGSLPFKDIDIRALVAGSVKGLEPKNIEVVLQQIDYPNYDTEDSIVKFGILKITRDSLFDFKLMISLISLIIIILAVIIYLQLIQIKQLKNKLLLIQQRHKGAKADCNANTLKC